MAKRTYLEIRSNSLSGQGRDQAKEMTRLVRTSISSRGVRGSRKKMGELCRGPRTPERNGGLKRGQGRVTTPSALLPAGTGRAIVGFIERAST